MHSTSFPSWPSFSLEEGEAVKRVLLSNKVNYWTGEETRLFEQEFALYSQCQYAIALANGTVALDLALKILGIKVGDEVIVTPRTFIASVSSVVSLGAKPVFADVDRDSQNISAETIAAVITPATKAIVVVHLAGMPADMDPIMELAESHGIKVIEDCAQAHGATYKGRSVGSIGHVAAWSFCQDKIMTTGGEGGMVTTNDKALWSAMWSYKDHGKSWDAVYNKEHAPGFRWLHETFGTNWRMTELQGVLGRIQTAGMPEWTKARTANAEAIWNTCKTKRWLRVPEVSYEIEHAAYKAYVFLELDKLSSDWSRAKILETISSLDVPIFTGSCSEVYLEKAFEGTGFAPAKRLPVARELGETSLMFLVHPSLGPEHIQRTCDAIEHVDTLLHS